MGLFRETESPGPNGASTTTSTPNIEARLGALYSLERLLGESEKDQRAILETLCAYVRENSRFEVPDEEKERKAFLRGDRPPAPISRTDVQAAITIIGRRRKSIQERAENEGWQLDFRNANLIAYDFSGLNFDRSNLSNSFLNDTNMAGSSFTRSTLVHSSIRGANLKGTRLCESLLDECDVTKAKVEETDLQRATLIQTDLRRADVTSFAIQGANFENAFWSYGIKSALDEVKNGREVSYRDVEEFLSIHGLFQKATLDGDTNLSQEIREAIDCANIIRAGAAQDRAHQA